MYVNVVKLVTIINQVIALLYVVAVKLFTIINQVIVFLFQSLSDTKTKLGPDEVKKAAFNLILVCLL